MAVERVEARTGALRCINVCFFFFFFFCSRWECPRHKDTRRWSRATVHTWTRSGRRMGQTNAEQMWVADMLLFLLHSRLNHPTLFQRIYFLIVSQRRFIIPQSLSVLIHFLFLHPSFISSAYFLYIPSFLFLFFFALYLSASGWVTISPGSPLAVINANFQRVSVFLMRLQHLLLPRTAFVCLFGVFFFYVKAVFLECKRVFRHFGRTREHVSWTQSFPR